MYEIAKHHSNNLSNKLYFSLFWVGIKMSFVEFIPANREITHGAMRKMKLMVIGKEVHGLVNR